MHSLTSSLFCAALAGALVPSSGLASPSAVAVRFESPRLVAEGIGSDASNGFVLRASPLLLAMQTSAGLLSSVDGGATWAPAGGAACTHASLDWPLAPVAGGGLRSFGELTRLDPTRNYTAFSAGGATVVAPAAGGAGGLACAPAGLNLSVSGLPRAIYCAGGRAAFGCPFRLNPGGDVLRLPDGALLLSAIVYWGGAARAATSVVALRSSDGGVGWAYAGTIADAAAYANSQEGPNEHALALLADGVTVAAVVRLDAGDGPASHPYKPYALATSADGGRSWTARGALAGAGCARPRLLAAAAAGPLLLSGGRWQVPGGADGGWDPRLWVDAAGDARAFTQTFSVSFWHNALARNASWRFSAAVNDSHAPRQSQAYTSLLELDGGAAPGARARRLGITYNVNLAPNPDRVFLMPFTVSW
jgi:hypothetical protein